MVGVNWRSIHSYAKTCVMRPLNRRIGIALGSAHTVATYIMC